MVERSASCRYSSVPPHQGECDILFYFFIYQAAHLHILNFTFGLHPNSNGCLLCNNMFSRFSWLEMCFNYQAVAYEWWYVMFVAISYFLILKYRHLLLIRRAA